MKKHIKAIALVLFAATVTAVAAGCRSGGEKPASTTDGGSRGTNGEYRANIPDVRFDGEEFTVMCRSRNSSNGEFAIFGEEPTGVPIENAAYERNAKIEDMFGIKLTVSEIETTRSNGAFYNRLVENHSAGDFITDICIPGIIDAAVLSGDGVFRDLNSVPYVDLSQPWWQQSINESISLLGHQYFAINDMLFNDKNDSYVLFFNKSLFDDEKIAYPYQYIYDNTWTFDRFYSLIKDYGRDLDADGKDFDDAYGVLYNLSDTYFVGAGIMGASVDSKTGLPVPLEMTERLVNMYGKVYSLIYDGEYTAFDISKQDAVVNGSALNTYRTVFSNGKVLFMNYCLYAYAMFVNDMSFDVGVVPFPKYDEHQENYYIRAGYLGSTVVSVLSTVPDDSTERAGIILEAMAAESKNIVTPVYYNKLLTNRYAQDDDSKYMIDLIIRSEVIDLDQIFRWGNVLTAIQKELHRGSESIGSYYDATKDMIRKKIDGTIQKYRALEEGATV